MCWGAAECGRACAEYSQVIIPRYLSIVNIYCEVLVQGPGRGGGGRKRDPSRLRARKSGPTLCRGRNGRATRRCLSALGMHTRRLKIRPGPPRPVKLSNLAALRCLRILPLSNPRSLASPHSWLRPWHPRPASATGSFCSGLLPCRLSALCKRTYPRRSAHPSCRILRS